MFSNIKDYKEATMEQGLKENGPKWILAATILFTYALLVLGNLVTTTGSGLDCPDWPLCHGTVNPPKHIGVWIEWSHRLLGGVTGVLIIFSAIYIIKKAGGAVKLFMKIALGLILVVVLLGGLIVIVEAPLLASYQHVVIISSHIVLATIIFVVMLMALSVVGKPGESSDAKYNVYFFALVYAQVILGIVVRYSNASLACPDWPLCQGAVLPPNMEAEVLMHWFHRLVAYTVAGIAVWRFIKVSKEGGDKGAALVTLLLVFAQATLGVTIVLTTMLLPILVLHGAVGFALLGWAAWEAAPHLIGASKAEAKA